MCLSRKWGVIFVMCPSRLGRQYAVLATDDFLVGKFLT